MFMVLEPTPTMTYRDHSIGAAAGMAAISYALFLYVPALAADRLAAEGEAAACGPRAVFLLLSELGVSATYAEIRNSIPLTETGASLADLQACIRSHGVACSIRRIDPTDLAGIRLPMIAYLSYLHAGSAAGHFVVVRSVGAEGPDVIDPLAGNRISPWPWRSFSDVWGGVCLVVERRPSILSSPLIVLTLFNLMLLAAVLFRTKSALRATARLRGALVVAPAIFILDASPLVADGTVEVEFIRSEARAGTNAAAMMAACAGGEADSLFDDAAEGARTPMSIDKVRRLLTDHGCHTSLRRLTMAELSDHLPSVVLLRDGRTRDGSYCLVVAVNADSVTIVRAGAMAVYVVPADEFRYRWTGHALLLTRGDAPLPSGAKHLAAMAGCGLVAGVVFTSFLRCYRERLFWCGR